MARLVNIELILTHDTVGEGTKESPIIQRTNLFSKDGEVVLSWFRGKDKIEIFLNGNKLLKQIID